MLTVVPDARARLKVSPAGTVKELTLTVVHFTAALTSSRDEMVPVQSLELGAVKATEAKKARLNRSWNECPAIVERVEVGLCSTMN